MAAVRTMPWDSVDVSHSSAAPSRQRCCEMDSATEDELSKMVERVFLSSAKIHTVVFSGIERGVGCSWVLACAADILSRRVGGSVCVVEASGATPNVSEYLGNGNQKIGLASGVTGAKRLSDTLWTTSLGTPAS